MAIDRCDITPELCRQLLRYEPETGKLFWLQRADNPQFTGRWAGKEAFTCLCAGYRTGRLFDHLFMAHRVIWAICNGAWPKQDIDHISGNRSDNRLSNLRAVDRTTNTQNQGLCRRNKSGHVGVSWCAERGKWDARIKANGRVVLLGRHGSFEDAVAARTAAEVRYGFHENHGSKRETHYYARRPRPSNANPSVSRDSP